MIEVATPIWNQIAATQHLESPAARIAFRLDRDQLLQMEVFWTTLLEDLQTPPRLVRSVTTYLPLLTENRAISSFVSQHPPMRQALPEVLDPKEATLMATQEWRLTPSEQSSLKKILSDPRWIDGLPQLYRQVFHSSPQSSSGVSGR